MQVRDGPAAVRGDARRGNATGLRAGKAAKGEPRVRRPAALPSRTPRGRRIRASQTQHSLGASRRHPDADRARGERQDPGRRQDDHDLRRGSAARRGRQRAPGARRGQHGRRVLLRHDDGRRSATYVSQIGKYPAGRLGRLGVQGERRLAARRRRQGDAEGRRRRPLVLRHLRPDRRPADARASAAAGATATSSSRVNDAGKRTRAATATLTADGKRFKTKAGRACIGKHVGLVRATAPGAVRSNAVQVIRARGSARSLVLLLLAGCGGAAGEGGGDGAALGHARPGRQAARRHGGRGRADADARARLEGGRQDALRRPVRPVRERNRRQPQRAARLVLVRQRLRGRPQRRLVPAARRRRRLARLPRLAAGRGGARRRRCVPGAVPARLRGEDAAGRDSLRPALRDAGAEARRGARSRPRSRRSGRLCRRERMCSRCARAPRASPAELLGETAGDPVRFVWRGDPAPQRRYTVP